MALIINRSNSLFSKIVLCNTLLALIGLCASGAFAQSSSSSSSSAINRSITISNQCPFDVSLQSVGANAGAMACSPSTTSAQANCPSGFVCYQKNTNTSYCVAGSLNPKHKTLPVTQAKNIRLNTAKCLSGTLVTDSTSPNWGQCSCSANSQCASGQVCQTVTKGLQQCFWGFSLPNNGLLAKKNGSVTLPITPNSTSATALVASGKFYAKFGCDENGVCLSDNALGAPATLIEYTFQNNNDWYDVSYINGINLPATMSPVLAKNLDYQSADPYRCMPAGGDGSAIKAIQTYQKAKGLTGNGSLANFACSNNYDQVFNGNRAGFNFVSSVKGAQTCSPTKACSGSLVCGLTLAEVQAGGSHTSCGNRLGYWTYAQFCSANSSYNNSALGIACGTDKTLAYALCENQAKVKDQGPGRSCFNSTTTKKDDSCCGYESWNWNSKAQPLGVGDAAVKGANTSYWKTHILPAVQPIKTGCPLAYSFQYDDPYSTFTCATNSAGFNATNYTITLCPGGASAGINPPAANACQAKVPQGFKANQFTLGAPKGISIKVKACNAAGRCTKTLPAAKGGIYTALAGGSGTYQITATDKAKAKQVCNFTIPQQGCISRVDSSQQCSTWVIAPDGAWQGRSIGVPSF